MWPVVLIGVLILVAIAGAIAWFAITRNDGAPKTTDITIQSPPSYTTFKNRLVTLRGSVTPDDATIEVNGVTTKADQGFWSVRVPLNYGKNSIVIRAAHQGFADGSASTVLVRKHGHGGGGGGGGGEAWHDCGGGLSANGNTTCGFATNVQFDYPHTSSVFSPTTRQTYSMSCSGVAVITCRGGTNAAVRWSP